MAHREHAFTLVRDPHVYAIYRLHDPMPITVVWPSCTQMLRVTVLPHPPHCVLEFVTPGRSRGAVCTLQSTQHGEIMVRHGLKVRVPSPLELFCGKLVKQRCGDVVAWPHSDVPWLCDVASAINQRFPQGQLDAYWIWRKWA